MQRPDLHLVTCDLPHYVEPHRKVSTDAGQIRAGNMEVSSLVALWAQHLTRCNFSHTTIRSYRETLTTFGYWLADRHTVFPSATRSDIETWLDSRDLAASTRRLYVSRITAFYAWMLDEGLTESDPTRKLVKPKVGRYLPRPAPTDLVYQNLSAPDARTAAMVALGAYTGMRRFEIAKLRGEDIDLPRAVVTVRGKGQVDRRVPLNTTVTDALARYGVPSRGWVFPAPKGNRPLSAQHTGRLIANALSTSEARVTAHRLRHWYGSELYRACKDLLVVQTLMGHATPATTVTYTKLSNDAGAAAVAALPVPPEAA